MKKPRILTLTAVAAGVALLASTTYVWAASPGAFGEHRPFALMMGGKLRALNFTPAQKTAAQSALKTHAPTMMPLVRKMVSERRALHDIVTAEKVDESAIRAQAGRVGQVQAELAVESSRLVADLRKITTPEQAGKLREIEKAIRERIDHGLDKASDWLAQP